MSETTSYSGTVGDIFDLTDREDRENWHYDFGLYVADHRDELGRGFQVIGFWTGGFAPGLDSP